ncbi:MAG: alpha-L-rhamnosidase-related protein [Promethearchaeota archaeon]
MVDVSESARVDWRGRWIWASYVSSRRGGPVGRPAETVPIRREEVNVYLLARHRVEVDPGLPLERATLHITADSRYKLFINGKYIGRGINRCEAFYWYYDTYDLTGDLRVGDNVLAIHARYYGLDFAYYTRPGGRGLDRLNAGKGGLLFDLELAYAGGRVEWVGSGVDTRVVVNSGEKSDVPLKNDALGFVEVFDSREVPRDWNELDFDDSGWERPLVLDYPVKTLIPDENHPLHEHVEFPSEVLRVGENPDANLELDEEDKAEVDFNVEHMLEGPIGGLAKFDVEGVDALVGGRGPCVVTPRAGSDGRVLAIFLRFEREVVGYPRLVVEGPAGTVVDIIPSEKARDDLPALDFLATKRGSRLVLRGGKQFFEQWDWEGYLYVLLKVRNLSGRLTIHQVATNVTHMRLEERGKFECSDPALGDLWRACAHTLKCCAIDGYLDCPSREQRSYLGDAYTEALVANACFGEARLTKKLIYDTAFGQRKDGITYSFHPGDAIEQNHIIPDYCFYWMQIAEDYHAYYGDERALRDLYPHFVRALDWFWKYVDPDTGLLSDLPYWTFIDWSFPRDKPGKWAILNAQFADVLRFVGSLAGQFGDTFHAEKYSSHAAAIRPTIDATFWDEGEGCYRDYYHEGGLHGLSFMTNAYLVVKGITDDPAKVESIVDRVFDHPSSEENERAQIDDYYTKRQSHHAFGEALKERVVVAQPFFMHHVNKFFVQAGRTDLLAKFLRKWLPMLQLGPTKTIWETWSIHGSECHAWAATPAHDLSIYVLGVSPLAPGFGVLGIAPNPLDLEWARGTYPTCRGDVGVSWSTKKDSGGLVLEVEVEVPPGIPEAWFTPPAILGKSLKRLIVGGEELPLEGRVRLPRGASELQAWYE